MDTLLEQIQTETFENLFSYYEQILDTKPEQLLTQVEAELKSLYIREGNNWTGRGAVGDAKLTGTIASLEAVRAECISRINKL